MQSYLTPRLHRLPDAEAPSSGVALEVRLGAGRPARYELEGTQFHFGSHPDCDVRVPGPSTPPVVCRLTRTDDAIYLQRIDPAFPVLWNDRFLPENTATRLQHGDRIALGPLDLTVQLSGIYLHPDIATPPVNSPEGTRPYRPENTSVTPPRYQPPPTYGPDVTAQHAEREALKRERAELDAKSEELEADRILWYQRRAQLEAEWNGAKTLAEREAALSTRAGELDRFQTELTKLREQLVNQYQERRDQIAQMQSVVSGASADLTTRREQLERENAELAQRRDRQDAEYRERLASLEREASEYRQGLVEHETSRVQHSLVSTPTEEREEQLERDIEALRFEREQFGQELVRLERRQTLIDVRQREIDERTAEVDRHAEELARNTLSLEQRQKLTAAEEERLTHEAARQATQRAELDGLAKTLAERSAVLEMQQAKLAVVRASLDRQQDEMRTTAEKLATDRIRLDEIQHDMDERLREAEKLRVTLFSQRDDHTAESQAIRERQKLLDATLTQIQEQKDALTVEAARLEAKDAELNARTGQLAEQTSALQSRAVQVQELEARLDADRVALQARQQTLTEADTARQTFQEQLRRRADELTARTKSLDEATQRITADKADLDRLRAELATEKESLHSTHHLNSQEVRVQVEELERRAVELATREANLDRQSGRLREVGKVVALQKREHAEARENWDTSRTAELAREATLRQEFEAFHTKALAELATLREQAPTLYDNAQATMEKLAASRDVLRGHLTELHTYAGQSREELEAARAELRAEAMKIDEREKLLEHARAEHRLAVTEFRQQMLEWQEKIAEAKTAMARSETRVEARQAEIQAAAKQVDDHTIRLALQADELRFEKQRIADKRSEVEQHLTDLREWYRRKLKEIVGSRHDEPGAVLLTMPSRDELDPGDQQLGERLKTLDLVDAETLNTLWNEARRQRRTLRSVLLAGGAVTLYQLAMMETGNLNALMLGRLRVIDRLRVTPREIVYRVMDPTRSGAFTLRHLAEAEMEDAVRPDEFRQMFAAARDAAHPNLAATVELLEIQNRPAALLEYLPGLPSSEWPAEAATPGAWVALLLQAASGLDAAHRFGLTHGRLSSESFVMTADGTVKLLGIGEPMWLATGVAATFDPTAEADLRALGQVAYGWSQLAQPASKRRTRAKSFPESLSAVIRRLEADPETPMGDTAPGAMPYRTAGDLVHDLTRLAAIFPCPADVRNDLLHAVEATTGPARQSA
jgi:chromosome segregation ATPase